MNLEKRGAAVDDVVGEAEASVADIFGLDAIIGHVKVHDVVGVVDPYGELSVTLVHGGLVVCDIDSRAGFLGILDVEHGVEGEEDGQPEVVAGGFHVFGVVVTMVFGAELPVLLEGLPGVVNIAAGFA